MVFFTCGTCGKSLRKNQVEVHTYKCRGCQYMTCIDCSKDFWGNDYASHTTCLTENEKYGASNYVPKEQKGLKKQEAWMMQVQKSIAEVHNMNPQLKSLFENILKFDNIPRKKAKFLNFLSSSNYRNVRLNEEAWKFFEEVSNKNKNPPSTSSSKPEPCESSSTEVSQAESKEEPQHKSKKERKEERQKQQTKIQKKEKKRRKLVEETQEAEKPKKKRRRREEEETNQENEEPVQGLNESVDQEAMEEVHHNRKCSPFKWKKAISTILQDAPEEGMKMKKLKRKILALYVESKGEAASHTKSLLEIDALIQKKLSRRNDKYVVLKDRVKLRQ